MIRRGRGGRTGGFVLCVGLDCPLACFDSDALERRLCSTWLLRHPVITPAIHHGPLSPPLPNYYLITALFAPQLPSPSNDAMAFTDSPNARSKSITSADLETYGVCALFFPQLGIHLSPDPQPRLQQPPHILLRGIGGQRKQAYHGRCTFIRSRL